MENLKTLQRFLPHYEAYLTHYDDRCARDANCGDGYGCYNASDDNHEISFIYVLYLLIDVITTVANE